MDERLNGLVSLSKIDGVNFRAFLRILKEIAQDNDKTFEEVNALFLKKKETKDTKTETPALV